ncbi:unnamed protein product [Hydatigera taeniaeformis]|uniref:Uncharacterized protein n=1 Tax=Hydatigena taeniaeformis TaxID=6205 RepID=A0A158RF98_HYDTA|nr:unnamed protein product [Hydatigera taeniaeformis]
MAQIPSSFAATEAIFECMTVSLTMEMERTKMPSDSIDKCAGNNCGALRYGLDGCFTVAGELRVSTKIGKSQSAKESNDADDDDDLVVVVVVARGGGGGGVDKVMDVSAHVST